MKYKVGDKVAFMTRHTFRLVPEHVHKTGYIKQIRKSIFGPRYVICVTKSEEIRIVPERNIFHKLEWKEYKGNATVNKE